MKISTFVMSLGIGSIVISIVFAMSVRQEARNQTAYTRGLIEGAKQQALRCERLSLRDFNLGAKK